MAEVTVQDVREIVDEIVTDKTRNLATKDDVGVIVGNAVEELTQMTARGFASTDRQLSEIKYDLGGVVHRSEFLDLHQRVDRLEHE